MQSGDDFLHLVIIPLSCLDHHRGQAEDCGHHRHDRERRCQHVDGDGAEGRRNGWTFGTHPEGRCYRTLRIASVPQTPLTHKLLAFVLVKL